MNNFHHYPASPSFTQTEGQYSNWGKFTTKNSPRAEIQAKALVMNKKLYEIEDRVKSDPPDLLIAHNLHLSTRSESASRQFKEKDSSDTSLYFPPIKIAKKELEVIPEPKKTARKKKLRNLSLDLEENNISFGLIGKHITPSISIKRKGFQDITALATPKTRLFLSKRLSLVNPSPWPISSTDKLRKFSISLQ